jgi:hypothetical protein
MVRRITQKARRGIAAVVFAALLPTAAGCSTITAREKGDMSPWAGIKQDVQWMQEMSADTGKQFSGGRVFHGIGSALLVGVYGLDCVPSSVADTWHAATGGAK